MKCTPATNQDDISKNKETRFRIRVTGIVQGVGFRPTVTRYARDFDLKGWVCNDGGGVLIEAQGTAASLHSFVKRIQSAPPIQSEIREFKISTLSPKASPETGFTISKSEKSANQSACIPPDLGLCKACTKELQDPANRRFHYPFINCTDCGPRFSIITALPYDRPNTSMRHFTMCQLCQAEYDAPESRRFDAQPNACATCGPNLTLLNANARPVSTDTPLGETAKRLHNGAIIIVKGLGGYHLACLATTPEVVASLRQRKQRPHKPFAVMFKDLEELEAHCLLTEEDTALLTSPAAPILIVRKKSRSEIAKILAPDTDDLGVLLPYTPLHHLLLQEISPLVMTSANISDSPIAHTQEQALSLLGTVADYMLDHNRPIVRPSDDSVVKHIHDHAIPVRRSRGFVPHPLPLPFNGPAGLACGGDSKNHFCLTQNNQAILSQYIGDLSMLPTFELFEKNVDDFQTLFIIEPKWIAHDLHPGYHSTHWASRNSLPCIGVQHHHAHITACLAEHNITERVLGVALDGSGFGNDGTIWGGEFMLANVHSYQRIGCIRPFPLPGGECAIKHPVRSTFAVLHTISTDAALTDSLITKHLPQSQRELLARLCESGLQSPLTSSAGRLFDAAAGLLGICYDVTYEGRAAILLEQAARKWQKQESPLPMDFSKNATGLMQLNYESIFITLQQMRDQGIDICRLAYIFHLSLASGIANLCSELCHTYKCQIVALSGGVFQNQLLTEKLIHLLKQAGLSPKLPKQLPVNDGCIAYGQAVVALAGM